MQFKLWYRVRNGGDGSASVEFYPARAPAEFAETEEEEGWGESSVGWVKLTVGDDGKSLSFNELVYDEVTKKFEHKLIPLAQEQETAPRVTPKPEFGPNSTAG